MTYILRPVHPCVHEEAEKKTVCKGKTKFIIHNLVLVYLAEYPGTLSILFRNIWGNGITSIIFYDDIGYII